MLAAYPPDELEGNTDADTLTYNYERTGEDGLTTGGVRRNSWCATLFARLTTRDSPRCLGTWSTCATWPEYPSIRYSDRWGAPALIMV
jgi:hypothetical protein